MNEDIHISVLRIVMKHIQWMREEGETDLRSLRGYIECLREDLLTRDIAEVIAEYSAEPVSDE